MKSTVPKTITFTIQIGFSSGIEFIEYLKKQLPDQVDYKAINGNSPVCVEAKKEQFYLTIQSLPNENKFYFRKINACLAKFTELKQLKSDSIKIEILHNLPKEMIRDLQSVVREMGNSCR